MNNYLAYGLATHCTIIEYWVFLFTVRRKTQVHMQGSYSLFSDNLKVIHHAPNYHRPPLSSCSYPILCAKIRPVVFDVEEISMFIGVARLYADPIHDALVSYITFTHLLNMLHSIVYTLNLMRHQAFIRLGDKILP